MLEVSNLRKSFTHLEVLKGMDFTVNSGEIVGFIGANGTGKTTCFRSIMGLLNYEAGEIKFQGALLDSISRAVFGYMPEERGLFTKEKVSSQVNFFAGLKGINRRSSETKLRNLLKEMDISKYENEVLGKLSLGNQQRIQLLVCLISEPSMLILDEPFSGLDPSGMDVMAKMLRSRANSGAGIIFSSHQLNQIQSFCDRILIIDDGKVAVGGSLQYLQKLLPVNYEITVDRVLDSWRKSNPNFRYEMREGKIIIKFAESVGSQGLDPILRDLMRDSNILGVSEYKANLTEIYRSVVNK